MRFDPALRELVSHVRSIMNERGILNHPGMSYVELMNAIKISQGLEIHRTSNEQAKVFLVAYVRSYMLDSNLRVANG